MENCQNGEKIWVKKKDEKPLWRKNLGEKKMENCQNDENIWVKKKR